MIENVNEITEYINNNKENEEVINLVNSLQNPLTRESVEKWTSEGDGKSWLDRTCDIYSNKAIETARKNAISKYETETLPQKIEEALKKANNKDKTPEQIEIEELKAKFEAKEKEYAKEKMINKYTKEISDANIPLELVSFIVTDEEEVTKSNLEVFKKAFDISKLVDDEVAKRLAGSNPNPQKGGSVQTMTLQEFLKLPASEKNKIQKENPDLYKKIFNK